MEREQERNSEIERAIFQEEYQFWDNLIREKGYFDNDEYMEEGDRYDFSIDRRSEERSIIRFEDVNIWRYVWDLEEVLPENFQNIQEEKWIEIDVYKTPYSQKILHLANDSVPNPSLRTEYFLEQYNYFISNLGRSFKRLSGRSVWKPDARNANGELMKCALKQYPKPEEITEINQEPYYNSVLLGAMEGDDLERLFFFREKIRKGEVNEDP